MLPPLTIWAHLLHRMFSHSSTRSPGNSLSDFPLEPADQQPRRSVVGAAQRGKTTSHGRLKAATSRHSLLAWDALEGAGSGATPHFQPLQDTPPRGSSLYLVQAPSLPHVTCLNNTPEGHVPGLLPADISCM